MSAAESVIVIQGDQAPGSSQVAMASSGDIVVDAGEKSSSAQALPADWPEAAILQDDGSVLLHLAYPVRFRLRDPGTGAVRDGDAYEVLHLHRLKGKHKIALSKIGNDPIAYEKALIGCSTGLDAGKIDLLWGEMDQADINAIVRVITFFTRPGRRVGQAS